MEKQAALAQLVKAVFEFEGDVIKREDVQSKTTGIHHPVGKAVTVGNLVIRIACIGKGFQEKRKRDMVVRPEGGRQIKPEYFPS